MVRPEFTPMPEEYQSETMTHSAKLVDIIASEKVMDMDALIGEFEQLEVAGQAQAIARAKAKQATAKLLSSYGLTDEDMED